jgi:hypothetical protein
MNDGGTVMSAAVETLNTSALARFVELTTRKRELEEQVKDVSRQISEIEELLLEDFSSSGVSSVRTDGGTVSIRRELWASCKDGDYGRACAALEAAGLGEFVQPRFNSMTLSGYFRELDRNGDPIPAALEGAIDLTERFSLRLTKR